MNANILSASCTLTPFSPMTPFSPIEPEAGAGCLQRPHYAADHDTLTQSVRSSTKPLTTAGLNARNA